jgi:hypothetical protein
MKPPVFGRMVTPAELQPGAWFMFSRSSGTHLCMALRRDAEGPGTDFGFVDLMRFSPEPLMDPQFRCVAKSNWVPAALQLESVELDVPIDVRSIHPDALRASDCFKPGALLISGSDYRLVIAFASEARIGGLATPSLLDGTMHWMDANKSTALIVDWRLVQRVTADEVREICRVKVEPGIVT